jgi:hypothetical protein
VAVRRSPAGAWLADLRHSDRITPHTTTPPPPPGRRGRGGLGRPLPPAAATRGDDE